MSRTIGLLAYSHTASKYLQDSCELDLKKTLDENQPREQAHFQKGNSKSDHLYALDQIIEK